MDIGRRPDRKVADGWGWGSDSALNPFEPILDRGGYKHEQILCTPHFRMYLAMGGGSTDLGMRQFAARFAVYLILRAIGTLTPATTPSSAAEIKSKRGYDTLRALTGRPLAWLLPRRIAIEAAMKIVE